MHREKILRLTTLHSLTVFSNGDVVKWAHTEARRKAVVIGPGYHVIPYPLACSRTIFGLMVAGMAVGAFRYIAIQMAAAHERHPRVARGRADPEPAITRAFKIGRGSAPELRIRVPEPARAPWPRRVPIRV